MSSMQIALIPDIRAVASTCGMPGTRRSVRAPSRTTRVLGSAWLGAPECAGEDRFRIRSAAWPASSATRWVTVCGSAPTSATQSAPWPGAPRPGTQCGSQRTQFQCAAACGSSLRITMERSRGLCSTAAWATSQRARPRDAAASPAMPTTPRSLSDSVTGTSRSGGTLGGSAPYWAFLSSAISMRDAWSARPSRSRSTSSSDARRSHSLRRGPVAVSSTSAGSGASCLRCASSVTRAAAMTPSSSAQRCRYSFMAFL